MKKVRCSVVLLFVASVFAICLASAETFRNPVRISTSSDPIGLFVVDLNNDGRPDILWGGYGTAITGPGILHTLLAQASGGFVAGPTLNMPANVGSVCMPADETGDGIVDIVCPYMFQSTSSIYTFPGKGDGSFDTPIITPLPALPSNAWASPWFHPLADLNADGIPDLIVIQTLAGPGAVMLGDGHGRFTQSSSIIGNGIPQVIDVNGDGKADVLFSTGGMWLGKGDGSFTWASSLPPYANCVLHDMDNDGKPDAVCGIPETVNGDIIGGTQLLILHGNGDGTFNPTPIKTITYGDHSNEYNGYGTFQAPIAVLDLNGDGVTDILAEAGDGFTVITGQGQLAFDPPAHYATGYIGLGVGGEFASQIADLNGDGLPDVVSTGPNGIYITYARKDGTLDTAPAYEVTQVIRYHTLADFNEDGIADIAATGDVAMELNLGNGDGTFQTMVAIPSGSIDFRGNAHILHGDFNGDHHQDILAVGSPGIYEAASSYVLFGDGKGSFSSPQIVPNSLEIYPAYDSRFAADLNQDGRDDLVSNDFDHLYAFLSNGDGTFATATTTLTPNQNQSGGRSTVVLADFDHDGKLDAVWAAGPNVVVCRGKGDGSFDANAFNVPIPTSVSSTWVQAAVTAGDFDGDGNQDFAVLLDFQSPMYYAPEVGVSSAAFVFYGIGDGTFSAGVPAGEFDRAYTGIYSADLSKQGLSDLILKTSGSLGGGYAVGIVHSLPNRKFDSEVNYYAGTGLADISIADLNHDGFVDLLFSNGDYNIRASSVTVLMNLGNPPVTGNLTVSPEPSQYNQALALNAAFIPSSFTPVTGTVAFTMDGNSIGSASISNNAASLSLPAPISPGTHSLTATWPGNSIYSAVTLSAPHQVEKVPSSVTLSSNSNPAPLGGSVTFTASISSVLSVVAGADSVTFFDGQSQLGAAVAVGPEQTAAYTTSSLALGSHSITAVYSGNSQVLSSTSSGLTESIPYFIGDFSIQATPAAATVTAGQSAAFQLAIKPSGGFVAPMTFSCSGLPALATCVFSPSTLSSGQGEVSLKVQTVSSTQSASLSPSSSLPTGGAAVVLAGFVFWLLPSRSRRRRFASFLVLVIVSLAAVLTTSCGSGGGGGSRTGNSTPPGNYQLSVTARTTEPSQNMSHSTTITLTVQ